MGREKPAVDIGMSLLPGAIFVALVFWFPQLMTQDYIGIGATVYACVLGPILLWRWWVIHKPEPARLFRSFLLKSRGPALFEEKHGRPLDAMNDRVDL